MAPKFRFFFLTYGVEVVLSVSLSLIARCSSSLRPGPLPERFSLWIDARLTQTELRSALARDLSENRSGDWALRARGA